VIQTRDEQRHSVAQPSGWSFGIGQVGFQATGKSKEELSELDRLDARTVGAHRAGAKRTP
jgi:hypothetical protein